MTYRTEIEVHFADLDAYGQVNNATFFTYLETARIKLFRECFAEHLQSGLLFLVAEASCRYLKPIGLNDKVFISLQSERVGRSSFTLSYRIDDGTDRLFAEARTVMVCFDAKAGSPVTIPTELHQALSATA